MLNNLQKFAPKDTSTQVNDLEATTTLSNLTFDGQEFSRIIDTLQKDENMVQSYYESLALTDALEKFSSPQALAAFVAGSTEGLSADDYTKSDVAAQEFLSNVISKLGNWFKDRNKGKLNVISEMQIGQAVRAFDDDIETVIELLKRKTVKHVFNADYGEEFYLRNAVPLKLIAEMVGDVRSTQPIVSKILEMAAPTNRADLENNFKEVSKIVGPHKKYLDFNESKTRFEYGMRLTANNAKSGSIPDLGYDKMSNYKDVLSQLEKFDKLEDLALMFFTKHKELSAARDQLIIDKADKEHIFAMNRWIAFILNEIGYTYILTVNAYVVISLIRFPYMLLSQKYLFVDITTEEGRNLTKK